MDKHDGHKELIEGFFKQQMEVFEGSEQGIYVFLDDDCRMCNQKFASLLGYASAEEWFKVEVKGAFPDAFVADESQSVLVNAYQEAMEKMNGSTIMVNWKKKSGGVVKTMVILVPVEFDGHMLAMHFVTER